MGLEEEIKKEEEELAKLEADEAEGGASEDDKDEEKGEETPGEENRDEDDKDEEKDDDEGSDKDEDGDEEDSDEDDKDEEKGGNDSNAKLRIERKRRLKLEEELAELRRMKENGGQAQTPPGKTEGGKEEKTLTADERLDRIENEREQQALQSQAIEEFQAIEKAFQKDTPDYEDASKHMITSMYQGVLHANPHLSEKQAAAHVHKTVLQIASQAARNGQNPAEVLYQMSFDRYGFQGGKAAEKKKTSKADNLKTIAKNKKRSASSLAGGGQGAASNATIEEAVNMDLSAFGNMSEAEIDALIAQAD